MADTEHTENPSLSESACLTMMQKRRWLNDLTDEERVARKKEQNRRACWRRNERIKARKEGRPEVPLLSPPAEDDAERLRRHAASERRRRAEMSRVEREAYLARERERSRERRPREIEVRKAYYRLNKARIVASVTAWQVANPDKVRIYHARVRERERARTAANPRIKQDRALLRRTREFSRYREDTAYRTLKLLRSSVRQALSLQRAGRRTVSTRALIGCSVEHLVRHLERQFKHGMSWANHGHFGASITGARAPVSNCCSSVVTRWWGLTDPLTIRTADVP